MLGTGLSFLWGMVPKVQQGGTEFEPQELGSPPPPRKSSAEAFVLTTWHGGVAGCG